jgi:hypothetical protein
LVNAEEKGRKKSRIDTEMQCRDIWGGGGRKKHTQGKSERKAVQAQEGKYSNIPGDKVFQGGIFSFIGTARYSF